MIKFNRPILALLALAVLLLGPPLVADADAQATISSDFALNAGGDTPSPGIALTAPMFTGGVVDVGLVGRITRSTWTAGDMTEDAVTTTAAVRVTSAAPIWRIRPYIDVGLSNLNGTFAVRDALALDVTPGLQLYVRESWGLGFSLPTMALYDVPGIFKPGNRFVVSIFGHV